MSKSIENKAETIKLEDVSVVQLDKVTGGGAQEDFEAAKAALNSAVNPSPQEFARLVNNYDRAFDRLNEERLGILDK